MTYRFLAILAIFSSVSIAVAGDTLVVAYDGHLVACADVSGDPTAECDIVWSPKGGSDKKFASLAEDKYGRLLAGVTDGLMTFKPTGQKYFNELHHRGLRTPKVIIPRDEEIWLGGDGPLVAVSSYGTTLTNETSQYNLPIADTHDVSCVQQAWHGPTQSFLCVGPLNGVDGEPLRYGLWIVPNTFQGLDWANHQFFQLQSGKDNSGEPLPVKPIGLVSDKNNVYILAVSTDPNFSDGRKPMFLLRAEFGRKGFGPFQGIKIGLVASDYNADLTQPMAMASDGRLFITYRRDEPAPQYEVRHLYSVWLIDPNQEQLPVMFVPEMELRIGAIMVRK